MVTNRRKLDESGTCSSRKKVDIEYVMKIYATEMFSQLEVKLSSSINCICNNQSFYLFLIYHISGKLDLPTSLKRYIVGLLI